MALTEIHAEASPERCFEVLADPRCYAHWAVGSREIKAADSSWPAKGSMFHHTVAPGLSDHTVVEEVEPNRRLGLRARFRPLGTALITVTMEPEADGCRLRLKEEPADRLSRLLFNPIADRLLHHRNVVSIERLKELAEGSTPMPAGNLDSEAVDGSDAAGSEHGRSTRGPDPAGDFGRGFLAGLVGGAAMSLSTAAEMRLTGREPSAVPAQAIRRLLGIEKLGETGERRATAAVHFVVAGATGGVWGAVSTSLRGQVSRLLLYGIATAPDVVLVPVIGLASPPWRWSPADMARTAVHHAVFATVTYTVFIRLEE